ncbi:hypothetical protein [Streptomyces subrutilus]|uniref:hypothetical protein n=1 Tax=Streptomyces subrutilus TaxID=36818 RepID=UPI00142FEB42|nr:hypothetical protein [Streptomyces subrutilus]
MEWIWELPLSPAYEPATTEAATADDWRDCTDSSETCLANSGAPARQVRDGSPNPTLCGTVGLLQERPTPYAWRDLVPESHSTERVMVLEVAC